MNTSIQALHNMIESEAQKPIQKPIQITYEDALLGLKHAIELKGADYIDPAVDDGESCSYFTGHLGEEVVPSCILGHVFAEFGYGPENLGEFNNNEPIELLVSVGTVEVDRQETTTLIQTVQILQDRGISWGRALALATGPTPAIGDKVKVTDHLVGTVTGKVIGYQPRCARVTIALDELREGGSATMGCGLEAVEVTS